MKLPAIFSTLLASGLLLAPVGAVTTTQTVNLAPGWNSVWLEVEPRYTSGDDIGLRKTVEDVFNDPAITIVAENEKPIGSAEFITDADEFTFNQETWNVWRRSSLLSVNDLVRISGYRAYLVFVTGTGAVSLPVSGEVRFQRPRWVPDSYNFLGFQLLGAVSFDSFWADSGGKHPVERIFRMQPSGNWTGVDGSDTMNPGDAYFVYSDGPSDFMGPVSVSFSGINSLDFGSGPGAVEIPDPTTNDPIALILREMIFTNIASGPQSVTLDKVTPDTAGGDALADDLRLFEIVPEPGSLSYVSNGLITSQAIGPIASLGTTVLTLGAHRNWSSGDRQRENLYRINFANHYFWLPILAENDDLSGGTPGSPDAGYAGLWVGEVNLSAVSSITESGAPLRGTTSSLPMRLIIHVDGGGNPSLLSHAMVMQTKTADDSVASEQVLVVNEEKIPFFEGIEERGGKRVGKRIESVSYDMPRKMSPATQAALLDEIIAADASDGLVDSGDVAAGDVLNYVNSRSSRPPELIEEYHQFWALDGGLGPGMIVGTGAAAPLVLDPFHRSNPFRHAFHPNHGAGLAITRAISITFDDEQQAGLLTGIVEESITGLGSAPVVARGRIRLQRVSTVSALQ